ncbi:hypothetical protein RB653_004324 [Dictyostelium firmibasis]|uniref:EGF-like domain-containing protein n=1 Tax=Dictyostelium firmibasis TaxID=79012 RepID=A0AAN7YS99_9MYCE
MNECAKNLISVLGTNHSFPVNSTLGYIDFCNEFNNIIICANNDISFFKLNQYNKSHTITYQDFSCLKNLSQAWFIGCIPDKDLLLNQFPSKLGFFNFESCTGIEQLLSKPISPTVKMLNIVINSTINFNLPLSYIQNTTSGFYFKYNFYIPGSVFTVQNDLTTQYRSPSLTLHCDNLFPFTYITANQFTVQQFTHPVGGYSYFSTLEAIYFYYTQQNKIEVPFPDSISQITSKVPLYLSLTFLGGFSKPSGIIDISNTTLETISIGNAGLNFNLNGSFPIKYSNTTLEIQFNKGNLTDLLSIDYTYLNTLNLANNWYSVELPSINRYKIEKKLSMYLDNNYFTGTIDRSWCEVKLSIANNRLSGDLPSCFTCYYNSIKSSLLGNNFTNVSPPPPCTTIIPNLKYENNVLYLYGQDLGFDNYFKIVPNIIGQFAFQKYSSLFFYQDPNLKPTVFNITFTSVSRTFTLSSHPISPKINKVTINSTNELIIDGSYFTYNASAVSITLDSISCMVESVSFYQIVCITSSAIQNSSDSVLVVYINDLYAQISINENIKENIVYMCPDNCFYNNSQTICNINGLCVCPNNNYSGVNCSTPIQYIDSVKASYESGGIVTIFGWFGSIHENIKVLIGSDDCKVQSFNETIIECLSLPGTGQVDLTVQQNGLSATTNYTFLKDVVSCPQACIQGFCNRTGQCVCNYGWTGGDCSIYIHYITSVSPSTINGGQVILIGSLGQIHDNLVVKIGELVCIVGSVNQTTIICTIGPGVGVKSINITQNGLVYTATNKFLYIQPETNNEKTCPNNCSGTNGVCLENNSCRCNGGWSGLDCSSIFDNKTDTNVNSTDGSSTITNRDTTFKISIVSLNEIGYDGSLVESHLLGQSVINSTNSTDTIHRFSRKLENNNATISYIIEQVKDQNKQFEFAGVSFIVEKGSIKITIMIDNYQYKSQLNTLDLLVESKTESNNESDDDCNSSETVFSNQSEEDMYYIKIEKNSKVFFGRFISKMISNGKPTYLPSKIVSNSSDSSIIALKLTHCDHCIIDPDFSLLVSNDFDETCDKSGIPSYVIALSTVLPVVGVTALICSIIYYQKRYKQRKLLSIMMKKLKS